MPLHLPLVEDLLSLLQRCHKEKSSFHTPRLCIYMHRSGLDSHASLSSLLISDFVNKTDSMCCGHQICGTHDYPRSQTSLNSLFIGYVKCGKPSRALMLYQRVSGECDHDKYRINEYALGALLQACVAMRDVKQGRHIHADIVQRRLLEENVFLGSAVVNMYAKCGFVLEAQEVFDILSMRNAVLWNTIISGYTENGYIKEALDAFAHMQIEGISPDVVTFVCCLKACGDGRDLSKGNELHAEIARKGRIAKDMFITSSLLNMYAKCGYPEKAQEVFDWLPTRNVVLWNVLISGYAENRCDEEALACFIQMQHDGFLYDEVTILSVLKCCGSLGAIDMGQGIHAEVMKKAYEKSCVVASSLVDMYAKCGFLVEAQESFDELPFRDAISWTTLISGYVEHGFEETAFRFYEQMEEDGISSGVITYLSMLKACGKTQAGQKGLEMHIAISKKGLETDVYISNSLIDFYAKCGWLLEARRIFTRIPVQEIVSWNALIAGYIDNGCGIEALECIDQLQDIGILGDSSTLVCALKACSITGAGADAREIHAFICTKGLETDFMLSNAIVDAYAKCGFLVEAKGLVVDAPFQSKVSWHTLLTGFVEHGRDEEALEYAEDMQRNGIPQNVISYVYRLKPCANLCAADKGQEIHSEILVMGLETDIFISTSLVDMYGKCSMLMEAECVLEAFPRRRTVVLWTALVAGYVEHGWGQQAIDCFRRMLKHGISPSAVTFVCILKACSVTGMADEGFRTHAEVVKRGCLEVDPYAGSALIGMYAKCGSLANAQNVFDKLVVYQDAPAWAALIQAYVEQGRASEALERFDQMRRRRVAPAIAAFVCALRACGSVKALDVGRRTHAEVTKRGLEREIQIRNTLIDMYAKGGSLTEARRVFDGLAIPDAVAWTALLMGYADQGNGEKVHWCIESSQHRCVHSGRVARVCALKACASIEALGKGREVHGDLTKRGSEGEAAVANALIDMYAKCGELADAENTFGRLRAGDAVSWATIVLGYAQLGRDDLAFRAFERMAAASPALDPVAFLSVLSACGRAGLADAAVACFETAGNVAPAVGQHYASLVDTLARSGRVEEAWIVAQQMPVHPTRAVWLTVLAACRSGRNVGLARQAFEHAISSRDTDSAPYVCMSNIYVVECSDEGGSLMKEEA